MQQQRHKMKTKSKSQVAKLNDVMDGIAWVRGAEWDGRGHGVASIDGKLCEVAVRGNHDGEVEVDTTPISLKEAARIQTALLDAEINLGLVSQSSDEGQRHFWRAIQEA